MQSRDKGATSDLDRVIEDAIAGYAASVVLGRPVESLRVLTEAELDFVARELLNRLGE